jgi:hypothetical protein
VNSISSQESLGYARRKVGTDTRSVAGRDLERSPVVATESDLWNVPKGLTEMVAIVHASDVVMIYTIDSFGCN